MAIEAISGLSALETPQQVELTTPLQAPQQSFMDVASSALNGVNQDLVHADKLLEARALGESVPSHQLMIAMEQAKLSLQLTVEVRNRLLEGYQEIMRMQL